MSRPTEAAPAWMYKDEDGNLIVDGEEVGESSDIVVIRRATVILRDAAYAGNGQNDGTIQTLPTTPVQIIAAPGAGKIILPLTAILTINLAAAYDNIQNFASLTIQAGGTPLSLLVDDSGETLGRLSQLLDATPGDYIAIFALKPGLFNESWSYLGDVYQAVTFENQAFSLVLDNIAGGNLTVGNAANTLKVTVLYTVIDV
jgi:hypothetical protein